MFAQVWNLITNTSIKGQTKVAQLPKSLIKIWRTVQNMTLLQ